MSERLAPPLVEVLRRDDSLPMDPVAKDYWIADLNNPLRLAVLPLLRVVCSILLHLTYFCKRLVPLQFRAHRLLQAIICWFMKWFITPEANYLILRHFATESNLINFVIANSRGRDGATPSTLYPRMIRDLMSQTFLHHDAALFNAIHDLGSVRHETWPVAHQDLDFSLMRPVAIDYDTHHRKWTQCIDFETAHELFKTTFCALLTAEEYEAAVNSFQLDQSLAVRIARILDDPLALECCYNRFPLYLHGTIGLSRRFTLHGLFTEHLHAHLEQLMEDLDVRYRDPSAGAYLEDSISDTAA